LIDDHYEAINYDLLTRTGYSLDDVGGRLSWSALYSFVKNLDSASALARELGKSTGWETILKTNAILADIYDLLAVIASGKRIKNAKPYPRPGKENYTVRKIGKDPMTPEDLRKWYFKENDDG